jgi:pyridine nucleotide-disulfide oxidoreductase family protein
VSGPPTRDVVLVGGGHAHVLVLDAWRRKPQPAARLTLIAPDPTTPYSGMLPGHVAGWYRREEMHIDLARLARASGARLVQDEAVRFDREHRRVILKGGDAVRYDLLSIDIGITPDVSEIAGAAEHALVVKPIGDFLEKWDDLRSRALTPGGPRRIAVVGGGIAGICLVFAVRAAFRSGARERRLDPEAFRFSLVSASPPTEINEGARRRVARALEERAIVLHRGERAVAITPTSVVLESGLAVEADAALVSTAAAPPLAIRDNHLPTDERGFVAIRPTLQLLDDDDVFAAGDCATLLANPRPKAGVFAVRQGPVLARNLRLRLRGEPLEQHEPQTAHLVLIGTGDGRAIGARGDWLSFDGAAAWWLKDWIDRRFMRRFA